jgi:hypothetical protein
MGKSLMGKIAAKIYGLMPNRDKIKSDVKCPHLFF